MAPVELCILCGATRASTTGPCPRCGFDEDPGAQVVRQPADSPIEDISIESAPEPSSEVANSLAVVRERIEALESLDAEQVSALAIEFTRLRRLLAEKYYSGPSQDKGIDWLEQQWTAQSMQFAIDLVPVVHSLLLEHWLRKDRVTLLDVGSGSAAGANIWASLHRGDAVWSRMDVDAIDINPGREGFARLYFPYVNYLVGDAFKLGRSWDIVVASHVVEHVPRPDAFIEALRGISNRFVIVYCPYDEQDRIPGHVNTIKEDTFVDHGILETRIIKSMGWFAGRPERMCIAAVLSGTHKAGDSDD